MRILIITDSRDQSTCDVVDWLKYFDKEYIILTDDTRYSILGIDEKGVFSIKVDGQLIKSDELQSVWYRRGSIKREPITITEFRDKELSIALCTYYNKSSAVLDEFIQNTLHGIKCINNQMYQSVNKLESLRLAKECGLKIPNTILTTNKSELNRFISIHKTVITKDFTDGIGLSTPLWQVYAYTELVTPQFYNSLEEEFPLSLFQEMIDKKFEIRTFYLDDTFYSMAIFSQSNPKTSVDFRHYDKINPNRRTPFQLPLSVENKLRLLMQRLNLNSGSIDIVYSLQKEYYFLEVNPIGQFGMCSYPCNYQLEKHIAKYL